MKISVCMATYNGEKYIREQLDSIIYQLCDNDELIISDDGSKDSTLRIIMEYTDKYPNIIKFVDGPHKGVIKNFENAIKIASGDYIFLSDQDDVWEKNKVNTIINVFENNPEYYTLVHDASVINENGEELSDSFYSIRNSRSGFIKNIIKNSYIGCCMAFRKEITDKILPIPDNIEMHDWWIGLVSELKYKSVFINNKLIKYRRHGENVSSFEHYPLTKMLGNRINLLFKLLKYIK